MPSNLRNKCNGALPIDFSCSALLDNDWWYTYISLKVYSIINRVWGLELLSLGEENCHILWLSNHHMSIPLFAGLE